MQPLIVDQFGVFVGKKSERVQVQKKGELLTEVPLIDLEQLLIAASGVGLSSDVIYECGTRGIPITFLTGRGEPYATVISTDLTGTVATRREQLLAYTDDRGLALAKAFVRGKLANQVNLLRYVAKYRHQAQPATYEALRRPSSSTVASRNDTGQPSSASQPRQCWRAGWTQKPGRWGRPRRAWNSAPRMAAPWCSPKKIGSERG